MKSQARALTLMEVMISAGLLALLMGATLQIFLQFSSNTGDQMATVHLEGKVVRVEKLLRSELRSVSGASVQLSDPLGIGRNTRIRYTPIVGWNTGTNQTILDFPRQLDFVFDPGETDEGTSQDGDRYIDEGSLVLTVDTNRNGFDANDLVVVVADGVALGIDTYGGAPVGADFLVKLGADEASTTYADQSTTGKIEITLTLLAADPNSATGVRIFSDTWRFALRNP